MQPIYMFVSNLTRYISSLFIIYCYSFAAINHFSLSGKIFIIPTDACDFNRKSHSNLAETYRDHIFIICGIHIYFWTYSVASLLVHGLKRPTATKKNLPAVF